MDLFLHNPAGSKTGLLLPTGEVTNVINSSGKCLYTVSCIDVAVPMLIFLASDFGKTGYESISALTSDTVFMTKLREVWVKAGLLMQLR